MEFDVNKLLNLDYLNEFIVKCNAEISQLKNSFAILLQFEQIKEMTIDEVVKKFEQYGVEYTNVIQYVESDFIDENWEFADLFLDDINYSKELKANVKNKAIEEIEKLNNKINHYNDEINKKIALLEEKIVVINRLIKILDVDYLVLSKDVTYIYDVIMNLDCSNEEKFLFSNDFARLIIAKNKELYSKNSNVDTTSFEKELDDVYDTVNIVQEDEQLKENTYSETIRGYYDFYRKLISEVGIGNTLGEVMDLSCDIADGVESTLHSISKEDFCVELGAALYRLHKSQKKEKVDQELMTDALMDLAVLDRIYEENEKNKDKLNDLLNKVTDDLELISLIPKEFISNSFVDKIVNILKITKMELVHNLIDSEGLKILDVRYNEVSEQVIKIHSIVKMIDTLNDINNGLVSIMHSQYFLQSDERNSTQIYELQERVLFLIDEIKNNGYKEEYEDHIKKISEEFKKYIKKDMKKDDKVSLSGFVLFDFDEQFVPYVINDLNPDNRHNLLDNSISQKKMCSGFEDYSKLVHDLLVYGKPELLTNNNQVYYMSRIMDNVYYDEAKNHSTGIVRIRPLRSSLVRFMSKEVVLTPGTEIYKQVTNLIMEMLPNTVIDNKKDFSLFINFASSLKIADNDSYDEAINRIDRRSPLYNLFLVPSNKTMLTKNECILLKDILSLSLNAYNELEKCNDNLKFDIISQIGGNKSRG